MRRQSLLLVLPVLSLACAAEPMIIPPPNDHVIEAIFPGDPALIPPPPGPYIRPHNYTVTIKTGQAGNAGTDANVFFTIEGTRQDTVGTLLNDPQKDDFERGSTGTFTVQCEDGLGTPKGIWLRHDNTGFDPGWYVEWVTVRDEVDGKVYRADINSWLSLTDLPRDTRIYRPIVLVP